MVKKRERKRGNFLLFLSVFKNSKMKGRRRGKEVKNLISLNQS